MAASPRSRQTVAARCHCATQVLHRPRLSRGKISRANPGVIRSRPYHKTSWCSACRDRASPIRIKTAESSMSAPKPSTKFPSTRRSATVSMSQRPRAGPVPNARGFTSLATRSCSVKLTSCLRPRGSTRSARVSAMRRRSVLF